MRDYLEAKIHEQLQWMVNQGSQVILNQLLTEMQDSLYFQYSDIRMNNLLRQDDEVIKFDQSNHLVFEIDGTWFPA